MPPVKSRVAIVLTVAAFLTAGCTDEEPRAQPAPAAPSTVTGTPGYDALAEPAAAVLPLVPASATILTVTDLDRIRLQLGVEDLTSLDPAPERADFWRRAEAESALLTDGILRPDDALLLEDYQFSQDDVDWEAHFTGADGDGYVLSFRLGLDMGVVQRAVNDGVGRLAAADVLIQEHLVLVGTADDPQESWAADPELSALVGLPADSTYLERGCVPYETALGPPADRGSADQPVTAPDLGDLAPVTAFSLGFEGTIATARLGAERADVFQRLSLGHDWPAEDPAFTDAFGGGVADPATGRIGYDLVDAAVAARLALSRTLPFAVCNDPS